MKKFADSVIYGNFYTVDEKNPKAQAVAIKDGKFIYVGDSAGVKDFIGENTQEKSYNDGMILPGFVDGHAHGNLGGSKMLLMCPLNDCRTLDAIRDKLKKFIADNPEMDKIQGMGWNDADFGVDGPTAAMKLKNITKDTPDISDGIIVRDSEGNPTGCFREGTKIYFDDLLYHFTVDEYKKALLKFQEVFLSLGITTTFDPMVNYDYGSENVMEAYHQLDKEGKLKLRVYGGYQVFVDKNPVEDVENGVKLREKFKGDRFAVDNIKILLDGVVENATAYLLEPYSNNKDDYGLLRFDEDTLTATVKKANEMNITMHIHTIGDGAINVALNAFEKAQTKPEHRAALTHLQIVNSADIDRMAKLGVVAVANPYWFVKELDYHQNLSVPYLGEERAEKQYPMKSFFDKNIVVTQATDYPVTEDLRPINGIQTAVIRQIPGKPETLLNPSERVTVEQMIKVATFNGAYQFKCEDTLGSITVGKIADMVVLDSDITACESEKIAGAKVLGTMIGGEWVYTLKK